MAKKKAYRFPLYLLARCLAGFFWVLPRPWMLACAKGLGRFAFYIVKKQRQYTIRHLTVAFQSEKSPEAIRRIAQEVFENLAMTAGEILQTSKLTRNKVAAIVDYGDACETYNALLEEGRGLISITAHLGNWELLAGSFGIRDYQGLVLARRIYYKRYNDWVVGLRKKLNVTTLYRDDASREILKRLKRGEIVGLLPDQDIDSLKGVFVPFFGKPAYTPVAPVRLALSSGAPMVLNFLVRKPDGNYRVEITKVLRPRVEGSKEEAVQKYTALWMEEFEQVIRRYPGQWSWMHNRWKTQPDVIEKKESERQMA